MKDYESPYLKERSELIKRLKALKLNYKWDKYENSQLYRILQKQPKRVSVDIVVEKPNVCTAKEYHCNNCNASYNRDNPDLKYCEFCNEKLEE